MSTSRLAVLIGTHLYAQALLPSLQRSEFAVTDHCLQAAQLHEAIEAHLVDVALVSTGPRGLDYSALLALVRRRFPLVVLDARPHDQRWASFGGVVLGADASPELVLRGLAAALLREPMRPPVDRPVDAERPADSPLADEHEASVDLRSAEVRAGEVFTVISGHGAPGRTTVATNLAAVLAQIGPTALVDVDLGAPVLAARLGANTSKSLATLVHRSPATPDEWTAALSHDLQPIAPHDASRGLLLAGPAQAETAFKTEVTSSPQHTPAQLKPVIKEEFLNSLIDALRARFDFVVCDTGVQWLDGDRTGRVPLQHADVVLLVGNSRRGRSQASARVALHRLRTDVGPVTLGLVVNQHRAHKDYDRGQLEFSNSNVRWSSLMLVRRSPGRCCSSRSACPATI
jgi:Mrp family chromosome partitioning ATPase